MGVDREAAVRKAEDLVREGKPDLAIEEYLRLVEEQPGDVGAANALGDLYAKVGNRAAAVAQFVEIGDTHRESGFIPKAIAFYKKALKVDPASDHALSQLAEIAATQELYADATLYLNRLLQRRREQNNEAGVADCLMRLGGFPTATADAKMAAARAAAGHVASADAARLWIDAADALERAGRSREAVDVLIQAASVDADDVELRRRVAVACADTGQIDRARAFLSFDTAGDHGGLLMALAQQSLGEGRDDDARRALQRVVQVAPDHRAAAEALLAPLQPAGGNNVGTEDVAVEVTIETFDEPVTAGHAADDWGVVTPDLGPQPPVGELGWDALLADGSDSDEEAFETDVPTSGGGANLDLPVVTGTATELEWSSLLADGDDRPEGDAEPESDLDSESGEEREPLLDAAATPDVTTPDVSMAFDDAVFVVETNEETPEVAIAEPQFAAAAADAVEPDPAGPPPTSTADASTIAALTAAADNPALQFQASAQLGRLLLRLDRGREAVGWLERATQVTTAVREQRLDVMYELADALESLGDRARALDVFADLEFDAASFRDVPERMARLRRALEEGRAP